jgi:hypothetical protein
MGILAVKSMQMLFCKILMSAAHVQAILDETISPEFQYLFVRISLISGNLKFCLESDN